MMIIVDNILNSSITGLVANKLVNLYNKPVMLLKTTEEGILKGSVRTVNNNPILRNFKDICIDTGLFEYCSGHQGSFGAGIKIDNLEKAREVFNEMFKDYDHLPISYYGDKDTYGLKYNLAFDSILKTNLFTQELKDKELKYYLSKNTKYSIPLDNRSDLTKTDWLLFVASLTDNKDIQQKIYKGIVNFLKESECRVPFSDLYHVETGIIKDFQNRPVQGGIFILLLKDKSNKK
jgi:hypothetical protein